MANKNSSCIDHPTQYLTVAQVASALQVSQDYVRRLVRQRLLAAVKMPGGRNSPIRISLPSVEKLLSDSALPEKAPAKRPSRAPKPRPIYRGVFSV